VDESRAKVDEQLASALADLTTIAATLSRRRTIAAEELSRRMNAELRTLAMRTATFETKLSRIPSETGIVVDDKTSLGPTGYDLVEFYLAPNPGQPAMPLARVASGGELSRVMLALKRLEAQRRGVATLIFDEVDAGIGGAVAEIVGRKLKQLGGYHQILCITHLAQIAAFADSHFVVEKQERRGVTRSRVTALTADDCPAEIARMLGGDETNAKFLQAARELMAKAST
jgi:DNA repair protein RecN (Recombination protein N)